MNRELIYSKFFDLVKGVADFKTASRRLKHWSDVAPPQQPALFVAQRTEIVTRTPGLNPVWDLQMDIYLYANTGGDKSVAPSQILNPLIDAIEGALKPDPISNKQTLGGLVAHAWIDGVIETDEGVLGDQAVAIIPVVIKTA